MWHTVKSMGFHAAHLPRFRVFCCILAAFWAGMILLGAVRLASASLLTLHAPRTTAAAPLASQCPMCDAMAHGGMHSKMKCCCHAGGATGSSCACACRPQPQPATLAMLVWSPLAVLPKVQFAPIPVCQPCLYWPHTRPLCTISYAPLPRPPRLL